ncbi:hypothetical protein NDU88_006759 [Pleurodeles waltl]|uniref:Uncharacterized protein n=1 Tax=Pleurodeles waltl TaxID=8319 RepID=A0AAV7WBK1_PLEWA|nr:hypothetical protein NDU88_006759 [Pleurodeles waltl]
MKAPLWSRNARPGSPPRGAPPTSNCGPQKETRPAVPACAYPFKESPGELWPCLKQYLREGFEGRKALPWGCVTRPGGPSRGTPPTSNCGPQKETRPAVPACVYPFKESHVELWPHLQQCLRDGFEGRKASLWSRVARPGGPARGALRGRAVLHVAPHQPPTAGPSGKKPSPRGPKMAAVWSRATNYSCRLQPRRPPGNNVC